VIFFWALLLFLASDDYSSIRRKMDDIEKDRLKPGSHVFLSLRELNSYLQAQVATIAPKAVRDAKLVLSEGSGTATAMINFLELNKARGGTSNWLMDKLLDGERPVKVSVHVQTGNGKARVNVDRVEVGGAVMQGGALEFLIQNYVVPQFPDAKVDQWFTMAHHMDHLEIHPSGVTVVIGQ
jgi:hypothetical protein